MRTHSSQEYARNYRRAFTLIELLVVISIISLLVAILLPALSNARSAARSIACAVQLKNIGVGLITYSDENDAWVAPFYADGKPQPTNYLRGSGQWWDSWVGRVFFGYSVTAFNWCPKLEAWPGFMCPEDDIARHQFWTNRTYGIARYLMAGKGGSVADMKGVRTVDIPNPSKSYGILEVDTLTQPRYLDNVVMLSSGDSNIMAMSGLTSVRTWHQKSTNILYLDGHVTAQQTWNQVPLNSIQNIED